MIVTVPGVLGRARSAVGPEIERWLSRLSPPVRLVASYHLGFVDSSGRPTSGDGGKAVRPALALLSAEAAGADASIALPGAVAVELVHNFSLLHDDVMDHDRERRHRPTAWALFGEPAAILAGDALLTLAHEALLEAPAPAHVAAARRLSDATARMIAGQADDVSLQSDDSVTVERCLQMMANKTGALLSCSASIGAVLAEAPERCVRSLERFGMHLGLAFQAVDDLLGTWGDPAATGKPAAGDLRERKKSVPVAAALEAGGDAAQELRSLLTRPELTEGDVAEAVRLVERLGGRDRARAIAQSELDRCLGALHGAPVAHAARSEFQELARFVVERDF